MTHAEHKVSLGFMGQQFDQGVHICQIFSQEEERQEALLKFILSGLQGKEKIACFSDKITEEAVDEFLSNYGISYYEEKAKGSFAMSGTKDVYFKYDRFDPDRMLGLLQDFYKQSVAERYFAARVIGEMLPIIHTMEGGSRLLEYESRVTMLLREYPITTVCQYDSRLFDGETIMNVLKVHPMMIVKGAVVKNPFYIEPEDYFESRTSTA